MYKHTEAYLNQIAEISETKLKVSQKKKKWMHTEEQIIGVSDSHQKLCKTEENGRAVWKCRGKQST